jgi:hypothetical protein
LLSPILWSLPAGDKCANCLWLFALRILPAVRRLAGCGRSAARTWLRPKLPVYRGINRKFSAFGQSSTQLACKCSLKTIALGQARLGVGLRRRIVGGTDNCPWRSETTTARRAVRWLADIWDFLGSRVAVRSKGPGLGRESGRQKNKHRRQAETERRKIRPVVPGDVDHDLLLQKSILCGCEAHSL